MLLGGTVCSCPQHRNVIGDSPRYFVGCPPGSNMGSSINQNSCLQIGHIAAAIILKPEVSIYTPKIRIEGLIIPIESGMYGRKLTATREKDGPGELLHRTLPLKTPMPLILGTTYQ
jgi:hypothetical protein